ncbi:hypothetical protein PIB30_067838 [Stylosanthes scabra]|uniref:Uncharacterized protein n=1 Tax=Stylosanthes scabra TaxID=79078 RepID=A0ABU6VL44_9FABA|nr:hypothetical protein [Stylosanthes scabra]
MAGCIKVNYPGPKSPFDQFRSTAATVYWAVHLQYHAEISAICVSRSPADPTLNAASSSNQELDLQNIRNECDSEMVRKMTIVSLWCIQTNPSTRPSISKVVEMLEGKAELLQLPPKPFWFSPSTSP